MCVVSMITDHYRGQWTIPVDPGIRITPQQWAEYLELKRKAYEYDKRTGQPHCEKADLAEWEDTIKKLIDDKLKEKFAP